jgi:hypothetical protein
MFVHFDTSYIYAIFAIQAAFVFIIIVPKKQYKLFLLYGILCGGLADALIISLFTPLHLIKYKNLGFFNILGLFSSWNPVIWAFTFGVFFYLLPTKKLLLIPFVISWAAYMFCSGLVFENFGIFEYIGFWRYATPFFFLIWLSVSSWFYFSQNNIKLT